MANDNNLDFHILDNVAGKLPKAGNRRLKFAMDYRHLVIKQIMLLR
jgi:hypothetical protein